MWFFVLSAAFAAEPRVLLAPDGLTPLQAPPPRFPTGSPPVRCLVRAEVGLDGVPGTVEARDCTMAATPLMTQAVSSWRWPAPTDETGAPATAVVLIPIAFTPKGSVPVVVPERCTYRLEVASTGAVRIKGDPVQQCEIWAPVHLGMPIPPAGSCELAVDMGIVRETEGWLDVSTCPPEVAPLAQALLGRALFAPGRTETRVVLDLPTPPTQATAPRPLGGTPVAQTPEESHRLAAETTSTTLDPKLETGDTTVPTVDLTPLTERDKK
jgi:hypothetical protein